MDVDHLHPMQYRRGDILEKALKIYTVEVVFKREASMNVSMANINLSPSS